MGCWGMGIAQSDEFCEVYDRFMQKYNQGVDISQISREIIEHYTEEFDENDEILHDVYFAIAKAEWMCCDQSKDILSRVNAIIKSGANIDFYRELGASEKDLRLRQKNLEAFYNSLKTPRSKPRQRRIDPLDRVKELPGVSIGECYRYKFDTGYRILIILDRKKVDGFLETVYCAILENTFSSDEIKTVDFLNERIGSLACYAGVEFPGKSTIKKITSISVPADLQTQLLGADGVVLGSKKNFKSDFKRGPECTVSELFGLNAQPNATVYTRYGSRRDK